VPRFDVKSNRECAYFADSNDRTARNAETLHVQDTTASCAVECTQQSLHTLYCEDVDIPKVPKIQFDATLPTLLTAAPMPAVLSYRRYKAYPWLMN